MGSEISIFSLYEVGNEQWLLLRVERRISSNIVEADYQASLDEADEMRELLLTQAVTELGLPADIDRTLVGELQELPVGDELLNADDRSSFGVWVAPTRFGVPWVVLGTAPNEFAFWKEVAEDADLESLGAIPPALFREVYFVSDRVLTT